LNPKLPEYEATYGLTKAPSAKGEFHPQQLDTMRPGDISVISTDAQKTGDISVISTDTMKPGDTSVISTDAQKTGDISVISTDTMKPGIFLSSAQIL
jgi:ethanolamine utilization microcompartment shell protein EutS